MLRKKAEKDFLDVTGLGIGIQKVNEGKNSIALTVSGKLLKDMNWIIDETRLVAEFANGKMIVRAATDEEHFSNSRSKSLISSSKDSGRVRFSKFPDWIVSVNTYSRHAQFRKTMNGSIEILIPDEFKTEGPKLFRKIELDGCISKERAAARQRVHVDPATGLDRSSHLVDAINFMYRKPDPTFTKEQFETALDVAVGVALKHVKKANEAA